jgi:hypothetical protein
VFLTEPARFAKFFYSGRMVYYDTLLRLVAGHDTAARTNVPQSLLTGYDGDYNQFPALSSKR